MKLNTVLLLCAACLFTAAPLQAQDANAATPRAELRAMVVGDTEADHDRDVIARFLEGSGVADVASAHGIDVEQMKAGVGALEADAARDLAERVQDVEQEALVGGDAIVISSTAIVIALLVVILIAVS
jgi:hypothetical protein